MFSLSRRTESSKIAKNYKADKANQETNVTGMYAYWEQKRWINEKKEIES